MAMDRSKTPLDGLRERLDELRLTGVMTGDHDAKLVADNMVCSGAVGALEAFIWETVDQQVCLSIPDYVEVALNLAKDRRSPEVSKSPLAFIARLAAASTEALDARRKPSGT